MKKLYVQENDACGVDAVQALSCTIGKEINLPRYW